MPSKYLLIFPEDMPSTVPNDHAMYVKVASETADHVMVEERGASNAPLLRLPRSVVETRRVTAAEYRRGKPGLKMRQAVAGIVNGRPIHGQVIGYDGSTLTVRCGSQLVDAPSSSVEEIAPVLCFLLANTELPRVRSADALAAMHHKILDRLLGDNGETATRDIGQLLQGLVPRDQQIPPNASLLWINPHTGAQVECSVGHAVDFGFSVDGGQELPREAALLQGPSFCEDPRFIFDEPTPAPKVRPTSSKIDELLGELSDSDSDDRDPNPRSSTTAIAGASSAPTSDAQARILSALASEPELLKYYITTMMAAGSSNKRHRDDDSDGEPEATRFRGLATVSDLTLSGEPARRRDAHAFRPNATQRLIHDIITTPDHRGKSPSAFMDFVLSSTATKFLPHPAILARLYAFEFGVYGLSIRHFIRSTHRARRDWYTDNAINLHNFSPSVDRPAPTPVTTVQALSDCLSVLGSFAEEFFDRATRRFVSAARDFVEDLRVLNTLSADDIPTVAHWFDCIFEDYRRAAEADARGGTATRLRIQEKFNMQEPSLQTALYVITHDQIVSARTAAERDIQTRTPGPPRRGANDHRPAPINAERPARLLPDEVFRAIPRHDGKPVCLRFLSSRGCPSTHPDRCVNARRVHHHVTELPPILQQYIDSNLGGLARRHQRPL